MGVFKRLVPAVVISSALLGQAAGQGFGGVGNIFFLHTTDYRNAGPDGTNVPITRCPRPDFWRRQPGLPFTKFAKDIPPHTPLLKISTDLALPSSDTVGCLDDNGWFINSQDPNVCGTYTVSDTISTRSGRCSFQNPQAPANPGNPNPAGRAFSCGSYVPNVGIEFYAPVCL
jgi:hypothetical protein